MERIATTSPLKCFALEQYPENTLCLQCPHRQPCAAAMGYLANRVDVDKANFSFMPDSLTRLINTDTYKTDPDLYTIEEVYAFCHEWVFGKPPVGRIGKHRDAILQRVRESEVSLKMYLLTNLQGWATSHGSETFRVASMTGDYAVKQVNTLASTCRKKYGAFDTASLDLLMNTDVAKQDYEALLLSSEMTVGMWIINYKLFNSGNVTRNLYLSKETDIHPYWLAVERSYYEHVLCDHIDKPLPDLPDAIKRHRWNVVHMLGKLKKHTRMAMAIFNAKNKIMPSAVSRVLRLKGLSPSDFKTEVRPVFNSTQFWVRLAIAIQHFECLNLAEKRPSLYDRLH